MGRKSQPNNIRALKGDHNKDRYNPDGIDAPLLIEVPSPPDWLFELEQNYPPRFSPVTVFNETGKWLVTLKLLTEGDVELLANYAAVVIKMRMLWLEGKTPSGTLWTNYRSLSSEFGLGTVSREKLRGPSSGKKKNRFGGSKRKRA